MNQGGQSPRPRITTPSDVIQRIFNYAKNVIQIGRAASPVLAVPSAAITANANITLVTDAEGNQMPLYVDSYTELEVDLNVSAATGTTPSYTLAIDRLGADGVWYEIYKGAAVTAAGVQSTTIGVGAQINVGFGAQIRIREIVAGTTPSFTRSISIIGK